MEDKQHQLISTLINDYYKNSNFSKQTSSHWKKFGEFQEVQESENGYVLKGVGFGENEKAPNILNSIKNIPTKIYTSKLLKNCNNDIIKDMRFVAKRSSRRFTYDLARQALTVDILYKSLLNLEQKTFCIIGDGYGALGCLLKKFFPRSKVISINLGRTLLFDLYYSSKVFPEMDHSLIRSNQDSFSMDFNYVEAENHRNIDIKADIFINVNSMQEMDYKEISSYFKIIRNQTSDTWFYCSNRISKKLPDGNIINFTDYGWSKDDLIIFNELCPWNQKFPVNIPPFIKEFDGQIQHRLIKVSLKKN